MFDRVCPRPQSARVVLPMLAALCAGGCQTGTGPLARWGIVKDGVIVRPMNDDEKGGDRRLMARFLTPLKPKRDSRINISDSIEKLKPDPAVEAEFRAAEDLFKQGDLAAAEKAFAKGARKHKDTILGERFQYYLGETQFQRGEYVAAHESFETLLSKYPGTLMLDRAIPRVYLIALAWLDSQDAKSPPEKREKWNDRITGRLPGIDVNGHAVRALEHVRHFDATGPLADDATLRKAQHYHAHGNFEEAGALYDELIAMYPKSPLVAKAQLGSIDAKMKNFNGPDYDSSGLDQAAVLIRQYMNQNPVRQASTSEELYHDLDLINDQRAEIAFNHGEFYRRTGKVAAAEYYFSEVKSQWPKSEWAKKANEQLAVIAKLPRTQSLPSKIMTSPGAPDPLSTLSGQGGQGTMGGMGMGGMGGMGGMPN